MLAATVLGVAQQGLSHFIEMTKVREDVYAGGSKATKVGIQMRIAEAQGEIELADMLIEQNCKLLDAAMVENRPPLDIVPRSKLRWNASYAVELCRRATERVFAVAGAHSIYDSSVLQRWHRDVNTACHHAIADFDGIAEARGSIALGLKKNHGMI